MVAMETKEKPMTKGAMARLYREAMAAGRAAAAKVVPVPMVVQQHANMADDNSPVVKTYECAGGVCGFAWVEVRPANSRFANYLKRMKLGRYHEYERAVVIWVSDYGQSMQRKEAHAAAMAKVFRDAGLRSYSNSRMD